MKINYIKVRGAIGFKKGLGVDEVEFDFSNKSGLIALAGPNGRGKTTLLELMSPYRTFASRKGALRHHFFLRDSFIETKFEYNGDKYHTIRKIDSESDRAEAFIVVNDESKVNGKLKEYDKHIIDLFGSQTLFYNSVFCAQGSGNFSDMTAGKIKELFVEFLRIERLAEYENKAKGGVNNFKNKLIVNENEIDNLIDSISSISQTAETMAETKKVLAIRNEELKTTESDIKDIDKTIHDLNNEIHKQKFQLENKKDLEEKLNNLLVDKEQVQESIKDLCSERDQKHLEHMKHAGEFQKLLSQKDDILKASSKMETLKHRQEHFRECFDCTISELGSIDHQKQIIEKKITPLNAELIGLEHSKKVSDQKQLIIDLEKSMGRSNSQIDSINRCIKDHESDVTVIRMTDKCDALAKEIEFAVDPQCQSTVCPALSRIEDAKEELPIAIRELEGQKEKVNSSIEMAEADLSKWKLILMAEAEKLERERVILSNIESSISVSLLLCKVGLKEYNDKYSELVTQSLELVEIKIFYSDSIAETNEKIKDAAHLSGKKTDLQIAELKLESLHDQYKDYEKSFDKQSVKFALDFDKACLAIVGLEKEIAAIVVNNEIGNQIKESLFQKKTLDEYRSTALRKIQNLEKALAVLENELKRKSGLEKDLQTKNMTNVIVKKELSEWEYLREACSKTGLQALEIDGATPLITTEANTLLEKTFGLESQIKIVTQDPESGREVFWIKVIREDGTETDFGDLSGGQKVWISSALNLGMTLVSKRKSERDFKTLFMDESDGALDKEKAVDFIKLYRSMLSAGDFDNCIFISHNQELISMADHEIKF